MGLLTRFNLSDYKDHKIFVETGTHYGDAVDYALGFHFEQIHTIEIDPFLYKRLIGKYNPLPLSLELHLGASRDIFPTLLPGLSETVFWLDAHFPCADDRRAGYGDEKDIELRLPLEKELRQIKKYKDISGDVFLIDDLRIYEDGPFAAGNWVDRLKFGGDGIEFVEEILGDTHTITKRYEDQGYLIATPK